MRITDWIECSVLILLSFSLSQAAVCLVSIGVITTHGILPQMTIDRKAYFENRTFLAV
jgi:hypothetical protein